ncbi:MAG TPA: septum formation initiator family protein [Micromonosporaceae bacterium]|nr:septum formation initiator family protein [Micromonosporaceae bacterium]
MQQPRTPVGRGTGKPPGRPGGGRSSSGRADTGRSSTARSDAARNAAGGGARSSAARSASPRSAAARLTAGRSGGPTAGGGRPTGSRAPARPASARRGAGSGGAAVRTRAPQPRRFTGRATVLGLLLVGMLLAYAYPVRVYMAQQAQVAALVDRRNEQLKKIKELEERRAKWDDPAYITAEARRRLLWSPVGETPYVVIGGDAGPSGVDPADAAAQQSLPRSWYGKLWSSVEAADQR